MINFNFLFFFILLFVFICSCSSKEEITKRTEITSLKIQEEQSTNVRIHLTTSGKSRAELLAPIMLRLQQDTAPYTIFKDNVNISFYNEQEQPESFLTSKFAKYLESKNQFYLSDSVVFINPQKGDTLYSDELWWDKNRLPYEFYTNKKVTIRTKLHKINGEGMESKQNFEEWHIIKPIKSTLKIENSEDF